MIELIPDSEVALIDTEQEMEYTTSNCAVIITKPADDLGGYIHLKVEDTYYWSRADLKELIAFLKAVRKVLPKESE